MDTYIRAVIGGAISSSDDWSTSYTLGFGAFGDDGPRRVDLGPVALERAAALTGRTYSGSECVVIGDSRADVECGRAIGARVVAVATGRTARAELEEAGADEALPDFADLDRTLEAIYG